LQENGNIVECVCAKTGFWFDELKDKYGFTMHEINFARNPFKPANIKAYKKLKQLQKQNKYDLIYCQQPVGGMMGRLVGKKFKIPVLYTAHGFHFFKGCPLVNKVIYKPVEKWLSKYTDVLITINEEDYQSALKMKAKQVFKINGIGIDKNKIKIEEFDKIAFRKELGLEPTDKVILTVSELNENKNYITMLETIKRLVEKDNTIKFVSCGTGVWREKIANYAKELGVENPAKMFNEGKWTYTNFKQWVLDTQAKLGENEYVLGGAPYYYWYGMTNAAGQVIANTESSKVNILSSKSKEATSLIWSLVEGGAVNTNITWAESDDVPNSFFRSDGGGTLMTSGYLWFVRNSGRWTDKMWGEGTTEFGYVPFPYPDDVAKEDTRIGVSGLSAYMYIAGRSYPAELGANGYEKVWAVMNEMFLNTIKYQEADPTFNADNIIETSLKSRIDDPESIEAIMFYNAKRVFYDPAHALYGSTSATPLKAPANNAMFKGSDYEEEFNAVYETYETDFLKIYSAS